LIWKRIRGERRNPREALNASADRRLAHSFLSPNLPFLWTDFENFSQLGWNRNWALID